MNKFWEVVSSAAANRHWITLAGGFLVPVGIIANLDPASQAAVIASLNAIMDHVQAIIGEGKKIAVILGPVVAGIAAWYAGKAATPEERAKSLANDQRVEEPLRTAIQEAVKEDKVVTK